MSEQKLTCSVCHAYLFEDDDVVYCPVCGAPHHRDCYKSIGHCAFEEAHGTDNQYKKPDFSEDEADKKHTESHRENAENSVKCEICGESYAAGGASCPKCGAPNFRSVGGAFASIDFMGGVPEDMDLGEGVTAAEARRFVFANTRRYIPKFAEMKFGKKTGWNWFALLFPCGWFLSRKMYLEGIVTGILSICFSLYILPFSNILSSYTPSDYSNIPDLYSTVISDAMKTNVWALILLAAGVLQIIILNVLCAVFGDRIYRNHVIKNVKSIKEESEDADYDYRKKGGTNFFLLLAGIIAVDYLPQLIAPLFK
ncbi:MAG: DUF2628 domain-containing protein [Clostridia bacterium]|nr:DUF2628 domain-containing protein [Clostridia bacterium]